MKALSTRTHLSTAYVKSSNARHNWRKPEPITNQFRFVVRMAVACNDLGIPYDIEWAKYGEGTMRASILVMGDIPRPKPLAKEPRLKLVSAWKPAIWDAVYRLEAYNDASLKRMRPGFVIEHSCGLSLVHPSEDGELGADNNDIRQNWLLTQTRSGRGFGLALNFKRATDALLLAASQPVDWTQPVETLQSQPEFRRAGNTVLASYGKGYQKDNAKQKLAVAA